MNDPVEAPTRVGIGLIHRGGHYLVRRRLDGQAMAGLWEFPGGKCEPGESPETATARECREEVGQDVMVGPLVLRFVHRYPHALVELSYYDCRLARIEGEPDLETGFVWVDSLDLPGLTFPGANEAVIEILVARHSNVST